MMSEPFQGVRTADLTVRFGGITAVDSVTFNAAIGAVTAIIGPNGAGKSSLLSAIMGLVPLARGRILLNGADITAVPARMRASLGISRAFQHVELFDSLTVAENIMLGRHHLMRYSVFEAGLRLKRARLAELEHRAEVERILEFFEIERWRDREVKSLPYGVQKIVGMARALASNPTVLLLDEVGSGLNREEKEHLARFVLRLKAQGSQAILWVEHDVGMVRDLADSIIVLSYGRQLVQGFPADVFERRDVQEAFIGTMSA